MATGFFELALVVIVAAILGIAARMTRQPVILAYLATGFFIGYFGWFHLNNGETFQIFADLGIMFLLFLIGLEINYTSLRLVGKVSLIIGIGQIIFTSFFGFLIALGFGFSILPALYIAIALTFSSTIIVVKLLSEKRDLQSLYGKISVGFLLVQDFVAILLLLMLAGVQEGEGFVWKAVLITLLKGIVLFVFMAWLGRRVLPSLFDLFARSQELLFLVSLAWMFLVVTLIREFGFSLEIGGFLAGLALANSSENFQIANRIKPLRDFFILIFFVILGSSVVLSNIAGLTVPIIVFSLFVLVGNPLIVIVLMGLLGYRRRTSFLTGVTVAQISEFSLVLMAMGLRLGHVSSAAVSIVTAVGVVTITLSTYLIVYAKSIFRFIGPLLSLFERKKLREIVIGDRTLQKPVILIGCDRIGSSIVRYFSSKDLLIVDFNPDVIAQLERQRIRFIFGDISDPEVFDCASIFNARLVISTSPDFEDNMTLLRKIIHGRKASRGEFPKVILRAETAIDARIFYTEGADYVLLPHFTSGQSLGGIISKDLDFKILASLKKRDLPLVT